MPPARPPDAEPNRAVAPRLPPVEWRPVGSAKSKFITQVATSAVSVQKSVPKSRGNEELAKVVTVEAETDDSVSSAAISVRTANAPGDIDGTIRRKWVGRGDGGYQGGSRGDGSSKRVHQRRA